MNLRFENDVKTYSIQTKIIVIYVLHVFENDVKTYSIQTSFDDIMRCVGLRMM